jgi:ABC-type amino acid transport substrate-binding protein
LEALPQTGGGDRAKKIKMPVGFALPKTQLGFTQFINTWLEVKKDSVYLQSVYDYWVLGENPKAKKPRWSVKHDVLGWDF